MKYPFLFHAQLISVSFKYAFVISCRIARLDAQKCICIHIYTKISTINQHIFQNVTISTINLSIHVQKYEIHMYMHVFLCLYTYIDTYIYICGYSFICRTVCYRLLYKTDVYSVWDILPSFENLHTYFVSKNECIIEMTVIFKLLYFYIQVCTCICIYMSRNYCCAKSGFAIT